MKRIEKLSLKEKKQTIAILTSSNKANKKDDLLKHETTSSLFLAFKNDVMYSLEAKTKKSMKNIEGPKRGTKIKIRRPDR